MITDLINKSIYSGRGELSEECIRSMGHPKPKPRDESLLRPRNCSRAINPPRYFSFQSHRLGELLTMWSDVAGGSRGCVAREVQGILHVGVNVKALQVLEEREQSGKTPLQRAAAQEVGEDRDSQSTPGTAPFFAGLLQPLMLCDHSPGLPFTSAVPNIEWNHLMKAGSVSKV